MLGLVVSLTASLSLAMEIHAAGGCPDAGEIERQLAPLLGPGPEALTSDVVTVKHGADGALLVALADARGGAIEERRLPPAGTCRERAETVAVTLAIWEAQIHPEISLRPRSGLSPETCARARRDGAAALRRRRPPGPSRSASPSRATGNREAERPRGASRAVGRRARARRVRARLAGRGRGAPHRSTSRPGRRPGGAPS